ncbi:MAG: N-acetylmuramoyl-L-alanine amidase [Rhodospirillales bacterium]
MPPLDRPSPNHNDRRGRPIDLVVLHYTGMVSAQAALERLCDPSAEVSAHYLIEEDGRLWRLVAEERRAWHAGRGFWAGEHDVNARSIGIELVNPGLEFGYRPFPAAQIRRLLGLLEDIVRRRVIAPKRVIGHSDLAPSRKEDPGALFPWPRLAERGLACHPPPLAPLSLDGLSWERVAGWLGAFGYGFLQEEPTAVVRAVQRRFRPRLIDGRLDGETAAIARWLGQEAT